MKQTYKPETRSVAVTISRIDGHPQVTNVHPPELTAYRGDEVKWDLVCDEDNIEVHVVKFTPKSHPPPKQPWVKMDGQRKGRTKKGGGGSVTDTVKSDADPGDFTYSITLNEGVAVDPEVRIRETP